MWNRVLFALINLGVCLCSPSCASFHFDEQQVALRHDEARDRIDVLLTYRNVRPNEPAHREQSEQILRRIATGDRYVLLWDWPFLFDIDEALLEDDWTGDWGDEAGDDLGRGFRDVFAAMQVRAAGTLDGSEGPAVWQHLRFEDARLLVTLLNRTLNWFVLQEFEVDEEAPEEADWDLVTQRAWRSKAERDGEWISLREGSLVLSWPLSAEMRASVLADLVTTPRTKDQATTVAGLLQSLGRVELEDGEVRLVFGPDESGVIDLSLRHPEWSEDETPDPGLIRLGWFRERLFGPERPRASLLEPD